MCNVISAGVLLLLRADIRNVPIFGLQQYRSTLLWLRSANRCLATTTTTISGTIWMVAELDRKVRALALCVAVHWYSLQIIITQFYTAKATEGKRSAFATHIDRLQIALNIHNIHISIFKRIISPFSLSCCALVFNPDPNNTHTTQKGSTQKIFLCMHPWKIV